MDNLRTVLRSLRCLQFDPVNVVAQSHLLVLRNRLGPHHGIYLDQLLWQERWLFEYWAQGASIVLTQDYPIHKAVMDRFPPANVPGQRIAAWMSANPRLRQHVLRRLQEAGPLPTSGFDDCSVVPWQGSGWTTGRNVERMLEFLWFGGEVMIAGRQEGRRLWDLTERCLPADADRATCELPELVARAAEHSLRALGVAREADLHEYFIRNRYRGLRSILAALERAGRVVSVRVAGGESCSSERWYMHVDALPQLEVILAGDWHPRTVLLSPFDNLISNRDRTERLWRFAFRNEMYVPKHKRQYGYYLLPILHGDRLVGRVSPRCDRNRGVLVVEGLYLEPDVRPTQALRRAVTAEIAALATFAGATTGVEYGDTVPEPWRGQRNPE